MFGILQLSTIPRETLQSTAAQAHQPRQHHTKARIHTKNGCTPPLVNMLVPVKLLAQQPAHTQRTPCQKSVCGTCYWISFSGKTTAVAAETTTDTKILRRKDKDKTRDSEHQGTQRGATGLPQTDTFVRCYNTSSSTIFIPPAHLFVYTPGPPLRMPSGLVLGAPPPPCPGRPPSSESGRKQSRQTSVSDGHQDERSWTVMNGKKSRRTTRRGTVLAYLYHRCLPRSSAIVHNYWS